MEGPETAAPALGQDHIYAAIGQPCHPLPIPDRAPEVPRVHH